MLMIRRSRTGGLGSLLRIILVLLMMALLVPKFLAIILESFFPAPPSPADPHVREVWAPVRVSTLWEEIEVWWQMIRFDLERYYRGE